MATYVTPRHFHDLGKLLLAFVMLWAYFSFSQFLIIWAGNLPEEIPFFLERLRGGWEYVSLLLVFGHFVLPFVLLLSRDLKRAPGGCSRRSRSFILADALRRPDLAGRAELRARRGFPIHWMDVAIPVGLVGVWLFLFARQLRSRSLLPLNDPVLQGGVRA